MGALEKNVKQANGRKQNVVAGKTRVALMVGGARKKEKPGGDQEHSQDDGPWCSRGREELWLRLGRDVTDGSGALVGLKVSVGPKVLEAEAEATVASSEVNP